MPENDCDCEACVLKRDTPPVMMRAKMYLSEIAHTTWGTKLTFQVVTKGEENKAWASSTPSGTISMVVKNEIVSDQFTYDQLGKEFYVNFVPVDVAD